MTIEGGREMLSLLKLCPRHAKERTEGSINENTIQEYGAGMAERERELLPQSLLSRASSCASTSYGSSVIEEPDLPGQRCKMRE